MNKGKRRYLINSNVSDRKNETEIVHEIYYEKVFVAFNSKEKLFLNDAILPVIEIGLLRHMNLNKNFIDLI
jgi:hypothetical protein